MFQISTVVHGARTRGYFGCVTWLCDAGGVYKEAFIEAAPAICKGEE